MSSKNSKENDLPIVEVEKVDDAYLSALLLCFSRVLPAVLNAAVDLNLFNIIAKLQSSSHHSTFSAFEIASQLPNQYDELVERLERMLYVLTSYSLFNCSIRINGEGKSERVYALSPIGQYFAFDQDGGSLDPLSTLVHRGCDSVWGDVKDAILDPNIKNLFQSINGVSFYEYTKTDKELNSIVNKAMAHAGPLEIKRVLQLYKGFEGISTLVDVGGGVGGSLKLIISQYPSIKGINFDLPQVVQDVPPHPGIMYVGGDMFESVPTGDAILLKLVCHNWADDECVKLLRNCHKALPKHGKVIVLDYIIPKVPESSNMSKHTCVIDNLMFLVTTGKERTEEEFESLCKRSGFSKFHVACGDDVSAMSGVMEFYK
ncbi:isoliquiritigenin 2'-O-methyltransferase-like [Cicer arietinum]|uniref:Isoliquiritigenin 2'-O-methyltransferase-like n=1 Tax=Cicer arietinum TaxID=3827 RepID=A0A1S2Z846_CICAR|nr:isoliquiritigenin 2'-O-methyltransferase-like [Cicer arietinum]